MNAMDMNQSLKKTEMFGVRTLWDQRLSVQPRLAASAAILVFLLAYFPNLHLLMTVWNDDPNYNHGFLVIPIALFIFWQRLLSPEPKMLAETGLAPWWGWIFLVAILLLRAILYERGSVWSEDATIIPAIAALTWSFGGWPLFRRVWPAIVFLVFMLPLPPAFNNVLALPLQSFAATSSHFLLQLTGMWAVQEGNVISLHGVTQKLDVALACNGLRMLMTMAATIVATVILLPLPNWKRITLILSVVPIALVSNMARIVGTGWCYYLLDSATARHWAHDWAGWLMMPLGLVLVGLELGVLSWLVPAESEDDQPVIPLLNMPKRDSGKDKKKNQDLGEI
jgi:exosortase